MKRVTRRTLLSKRIFSVFIIILSLLVISQVNAQVPTPKTGKFLQSSVVKINDIDEKRRFIFVDERRFRVSTTAAILNHRGQAVLLKHLRVPCKASIVYHLFGDTRDPLVEKIQLR
ncbi:hypothetical protein ACFL9T_10830 [Thermodesulfobacteriota bacterium]